MINLTDNSIKFKPTKTITVFFINMEVIFQSCLLDVSIYNTNSYYIQTNIQVPLVISKRTQRFVLSRFGDLLRQNKTRQTWSVITHHVFSRLFKSFRRAFLSMRRALPCRSYS